MHILDKLVEGAKAVCFVIPLEYDVSTYFWQTLMDNPDGIQLSQCSQSLPVLPGKCAKSTNQEPAFWLGQRPTQI